MISEAILKWTTIFSNICQGLLLLIAIAAFCFTVGQLNDTEESDKRKATIDYITRLSASTDQNTRPAIRLITTTNRDSSGGAQRVINKKIAFKIMMGEPFRVALPPELNDTEKRADLSQEEYSKIPSIDDYYGYSHLVKGDGIVNAETANALRYSLIRYLNAWDSVVLAAWLGRADCPILFDGYIKGFLEEPFLSALGEFNKLYEISYITAHKHDGDAEGTPKARPVSWHHINELMKFKRRSRLIIYKMKFKRAKDRSNLTTIFCSHKPDPHR
jgi:hypothetical protein